MFEELDLRIGELVADAMAHPDGNSGSAVPTICCFHSLGCGPTTGRTQ